MNVKQSLDILMRRLGNRTAPGLRSACLDEMTAFQTLELEQAPELPWFIITEMTSGTAKANERRVKLPIDFLREVEGAPFEYVDADGEAHEVRKGDYSDLQDTYGTEDTGPPERYDFRGDYVVLFPIPDQDYVVRFPEGYYARQPVPEDSTDSENAWFKNVADLVMATAGLRVSTNILKDADLITAFSSDVAKAENRMVRIITAKEEANRDRTMNPTPR